MIKTTAEGELRAEDRPIAWYLNQWWNYENDKSARLVQRSIRTHYLITTAPST